VAENLAADTNRQRQILILIRLEVAVSMNILKEGRVFRRKLQELIEGSD
jgi:hypothetical protein